MRRNWRPVVVAVAALAVLGGCNHSPWSSRLVSVKGSGTDAGNGSSDTPAISPDGTKVAFQSVANDLGPTDTNGVEDIYVRDLETGTTELVSVNAAGTDSASGESREPVFSPDGTKVAFLSTAGDFGPADTGGWDLYLRDLASGTTTRVSVDPTTGAGLGLVLEPVFSPDGTKLAFSTHRPSRDIYVRDLVTGDLILVSANATGTGGANAESLYPAFSPDGTKVAFASRATNLGPVDGNAAYDVYLRDLAAGTTTLVSANATGTGSGNLGSTTPVFSPDGAKVAFTSNASNLGATDTNNTVDVYLRDLTTQTTTLVSTNATGTDSGNTFSGGFGPLAFSPDGAGLVFDSDAGDLGPTDTNGTTDIYFRDLSTGVTSLVSVNAQGTDSGNSSSSPSLRAGVVGRQVLFTSHADDLGPHDTNGTSDVYVRDLATGTTTLVSANPGGANSGNGASDLATFSIEGRHVAFRSLASNLGDTDTNGITDIYVASLPT
jgi:Tol biopolymer transport system component